MANANYMYNREDYIVDASFILGIVHRKHRENADYVSGAQIVTATGTCVEILCIILYDCGKIGLRCVLLSHSLNIVLIRTPTSLGLIKLLIRSAGAIHLGKS